MKNRMPVYFASMAMFIAAMAVVPGSVGAVGYKSSASGAMLGPQIYQPIGCARPVVNTYSGGTTTMGSATLTLSGGNTDLGCSVINTCMLTAAPDKLRQINTLGSGTLTLSGGNTYSGLTTVSSGTLVVNGSLLNSQIKVVSEGALRGTGTVQSVTVDAGGSILSAGNSSGTMTLNGDMALSCGTTNILEIFSGDLYDVFGGGGAGMLTFNSTMNFDGASFLGAKLLWPSELLSSNVFNIVDWNSEIPVLANGLFFDFPSNAVFTGLAPILLQNGESFALTGESVAADAPMFSDNSAILTVIPEPASAMMLLFGAGIGLAVHRARRGAMRR